MKKIFFITILFLISQFFPLFAKQDIDGAITNAAKDIVEKCNANTILAIDDFESSSAKMTLYLREQLADSIFAEDGLITIVTREHMDKVEKEMKFQSSGVVSEQTIVSVAERLGARFVVFGKLEEFNNGYTLRVRMLDVKQGSYLFRQSYDFAYSQKAEQLLGRAPTYKKVAVGVGAEINKNSPDYFAPAAAVLFDFSLGRKFSLGARINLSYDKESAKLQNQILTIETLASMRLYFAAMNGRPVSGFFIEAQGGEAFLFINSQLKNVMSGGVCTGYRFSTASLYLEPQVRFGYPYLFGAGINIGLKF